MCGGFASKHISSLCNNKNEIYVYCHKCFKIFVPTNFICSTFLSCNQFCLIVFSNELQERTISRSILILRPFPKQTINKDKFINLKLYKTFVMKKFYLTLTQIQVESMYLYQLLASIFYSLVYPK